MGVRPLAWHQRRWDDGRTLLRADLGDAVIEAFGFPHYQMHRADLLGTLVGALPPERLHVGHLFTGLADHGDRVEATFENGTTIEVDLLVGADGIHSAVREMLFGPQDPVFTGCAAYRGLVPAERLRHLDLEVTAQIWMGPDAHFVHYFVPERAARQLRRRRRAGQLDARVVDRPRRPGRCDRRLRGLASRSCTRSSARSTRPSSGPCSTARRCARWSRGPRHPAGRRVPSDAALHGPGRRAGARGRRHAHRLPGPRSPTSRAALRRYEQLRLPRASRIQALSTENKTRFHLPDGERQRERDALMAGGGTDFAIRAVEWIYAHDAAAVDASRRPPSGGARRRPQAVPARASISSCASRSSPFGEDPLPCPSPAATRAPTCSSTRVQ